MDFLEMDYRMAKEMDAKYMKEALEGKKLTV